MITEYKYMKNMATAFSYPFQPFSCLPEEGERPLSCLTYSVIIFRSASKVTSCEYLFCFR